MRKVWLCLGALAAGLAVGIGLNTTLRKGREAAPPAREDAGPQRARETGLRGFVMGRMPEGNVRGAESYLEERMRQREEVRSPFRSLALLGAAIEDLPVEALMRLLEDRRLTTMDEVTRAFSRLAEADPKWAMEVKRKTWFATIEQMDAASKAVYAVWVRRDAAGALEWTYALHSSGARQASALQLTEKWLEVDPGAVAQHFDRLEHARGFGHFSAGFENQLMRAWAREDEKAAERWVEGLEEGGKKERLMKALEEERPEKPGRPE